MYGRQTAMPADAGAVSTDLDSIQ